MANKPRAERKLLSPQETRMVQLLLASPNRQATVEELWRVLLTDSLPGDRKYTQQRVGGHASRINAKFAKAGRPEVVKPGDKGGTYRLWPDAATAEKAKRARAALR